MPEEVVIPPTPPAEPTIAELRQMLGSGAQREETPTEPRQQTPVTPASQGPERTRAESGTAEQTEASPQEEKPESSESAIDKRFSKLAKQRDEWRQQAEEARQQAEFLRRELEMKRASPGPAETQPAKAAQGEPVPPDPDTWTGDWPSLRKAELQYAKDLTHWQVSEAMKLRDQQELERRAETERRETQVSWDKKVNQTAAKHPEIIEAIDSLGRPITDAGMADLIKQSEVGPEILLHLHEHPAEAQKLFSGNPLQIAREIGRIEASITVAKASKAGTPPAPPRHNKPPVSIDGGGGPSEPDLEKMSQREFNRYMRPIVQPRRD